MTKLISAFLPLLFLVDESPPLFSGVLACLPLSAGEIWPIFLVNETPVCILLDLLVGCLKILAVLHV